MLLYYLDSVDPYYNLALEEHILQTWDKDILLFWKNDNTLVVGRNQNTAEEINTSYVENNAIQVVRRMSGGGSVYHDLNNINFSFIVAMPDTSKNSMAIFMQPIVVALNNMGIPAHIDGRNDVSIQGQKVSGNAQCIYKKRILHHGTLLFDVNLDVLAAALRVKSEKFQSKAAKSVRTRVTNIKEWFHGGSIKEFTKQLQKQLDEGQGMQQLLLSESEEKMVQHLRQTKYMTWDWNYGETPPYTFRNMRKFSGGFLEVLINVQEGKIAKCTFFGDFMAQHGITPIMQALQGCPYHIHDIDTVLTSLPLSLYFGTISKQEILECMFDFASMSCP